MQNLKKESYLTKEGVLEFSNQIYCLRKRVATDFTSIDLIIALPAEACKVLTVNSSIVGKPNKANLLISNLKCTLLIALLFLVSQRPCDQHMQNNLLSFILFFLATSANNL